MTLSDLHYPPTVVETLNGMALYRLDPRDRATAPLAASRWFGEVCTEWFCEACGQHIDGAEHVCQ